MPSPEGDGRDMEKTGGQGVNSGALGILLVSGDRKSWKDNSSGSSDPRDRLVRLGWAGTQGPNRQQEPTNSRTASMYAPVPEAAVLSSHLHD